MINYLFKVEDKNGDKISMKLYQILAIVVMIAFYIAYFSKMLLQRNKGIKTDQMGKGEKETRVIVIERVLKFATFLIVPVELISIYMNTKWFDSKYLNLLGIIIGMCGVGIFIIAMTTMRDNWRAGIPAEDKTSIVTHGIYKISRNPAFLGFDLVYLGIFLAFPNVIHLMFLLFALGMLHIQILEEEKFLIKVFGVEYQKYKAKTGRYFLFF